MFLMTGITINPGLKTTVRAPMYPGTVRQK
jgi:hypothetical protein